MATRKSASLAPGTTLLDYASGAAIMRAFNNDINAIRREYSRQRSIIRKRLDRLEAAGETSSNFYRKFSDRERSIPSLVNLNTQEVLLMLAKTAGVIGGGYQSTVSEIRASRAKAQAKMKSQAIEFGDTELAERLDKPITNRQAARIGRLMGMVKEVLGNFYYANSADVYETAIKQVLNDKKQTSLLTLADDVLSLVAKQEKDASWMDTIKEKYTAQGKVRVSYKKAHVKRGK